MLRGEEKKTKAIQAFSLLQYVPGLEGDQLTKIHRRKQFRGDLLRGIFGFGDNPPHG